MRDFIDKTASKSGTKINRSAMLAVQGYQKESVVFGENSIVKTNDKNEVETITFPNNTIKKVFVGEKTVTQTITFTENGYTKELS